MNSSGYLGVYNQYEKDVTEKVYSYCFTVTDFNGNLFATNLQNRCNLPGRLYACSVA